MKTRKINGLRSHIFLSIFWITQNSFLDFITHSQMYEKCTLFTMSKLKALVHFR